MSPQGVLLWSCQDLPRCLKGCFSHRFQMSRRESALARVPCKHARVPLRQNGIAEILFCFACDKKLTEARDRKKRKRKKTVEMKMERRRKIKAQNKEQETEHFKQKKAGT